MSVHCRVPASALLALVFLAGCSGEGDSGIPVATNVVTLTQNVTVTNVVTVVVTNVVDETLPRVPSVRGTAPYAVTSSSLDAARLARFLSDNGARVLECGPGAVAVVEASSRAVSAIRAGGVVSLHALFPQDKVAADAGSRVRIVPLSSIDVGCVSGAVEAAGGRVLGATSSGRPVVRAELSYRGVRELAGRGDVRRIERDDR